MNTDPNSIEETIDLTDSASGRAQLLAYGRDLARIYKSEKSKRDKLKFAYKTLSAVFTSTPDGLVVLDKKLTIQQSNDAFCRLVEQSAETLIGKPIDDVLISEELRNSLNNLDKHTSASFQLELTISVPAKRALLLNAACLQSDHMAGWVLTVHDQTAMKRLERQKQEFINIAAHELRTPLNAILGFSEILAEEAASSDQAETPQQEHLHIVIQSCYRLINIIDELINFADLNQGHIEQAGTNDLDLNQLIKDVITDLYPIAASKRVDFQFDVFEPEILMVTNGSLVRSVLYQIMLNAVKFNRDDGNVYIAAMLSENDVLIKVADSGIGIPQTELKTIFEPFRQVEPHETRSVGGLGLGLSMAQRAITELGGTIEIDSTVGLGSTLSIKLPLYQAKPHNAVSELQEQLQTTTQQSLAYAHDLRVLYRQLQDANRQLKDINLQLDEANKLKSDFLGVISHELRSPFVATDFALQTFARYGTDRLKPEQRELLEQIATGFKDGRRTIDNLVNFANLLSKQGRLNLTKVNMDSLIEETTTVASAMAISNRLSLRTEISEKVLPSGDRERLGEALWHLVHNAIKFTKAGGQITVRTYKAADRFIIEVEDTGIGIPVERQAGLWLPFTQMADPLKRGVEGLGVGLALVHYVAVAHGGDVLLTSEPGKGSTIGFWLPLASDD